MKKLTFALLLLASTAHAALEDYSFDTIDSFSTEEDLVKVTGLSSGTNETKRLESQLPTNLSDARREAIQDTCSKMALVAMTRPGRFRLAMHITGGNGGVLWGCALTARK